MSQDFPDGPVVNSALLPKFTGNKVRLPGKVVKISGDEAILEASDGGQVHVHKVGMDDIQAMGSIGNFVEVIGTVQSGGSALRSIKTYSLGDKLDLRVVEGLVDLSFKHPQIFHPNH